MTPGKEPPKVVAAPALVVAPPATPAQVGDKNIAPTTTAAEDETKLGQRRINLVWEITQAGIAIIVTTATLYVAGRLAMKAEGDVAAFLLLSNVFFMIASTYFARTNHQKVGGVGKDDAGR